MPVRPDAQNLFAATPGAPVTHVRLNIFPDGGVARFRVFGRVAADWARGRRSTRDARRRSSRAASISRRSTNGGLALACSDAFFGPMNNLLLPGRAENMGGGWETRRKRAACTRPHDWILIRLGARGTISAIEVDTNHFKGNYPGSLRARGHRRRRARASPT